MGHARRSPSPQRMRVEIAVPSPSTCSPQARAGIGPPSAAMKACPMVSVPSEVGASGHDQPIADDICTKQPFPSVAGNFFPATTPFQLFLDFQHRITFYLKPSGVVVTSHCIRW